MRAGSNTSSSAFLAAILIALCFTWSPTTNACGLCQEDARSAVYSANAARMVAAAPERYEFVVFRIEGEFSKRTAEDLSGWLKLRTEVDPESVKTAKLPKAVGFVFDKTDNFDALQAELLKNFSQLVFRRVQ